MKTRYLIGILVVVAAMFFLFKKDHSGNHPEATKISEDDSVESDQPARADTEKKSDEVAQNQPVGASGVNEKALSLAVSAEQIEEIQKNFSNQLRQMGQCLAVQVHVDQEKVDPQYEALTNGLSAAFGNMLVKMDDWTQWEGQASDGTLKRIRTEIEYLENNIPTKRVQLYKLNAQGMPELQPLSEDIALNPPDEALISMRGDAKTILEEKATRGYYGEGEELVVVERNGKIQSFSMSKGEKTFSCAQTDTVNSRCECL